MDAIMADLHAQSTMRDTASTLRYDSPAYEAHADVIDDLVKQAEHLHLLRGKFRSDILGRDGIVCSRSRGDDGQSVSRSYFSLAISLERGTVARSKDTRDLVMNVLAARFSLGERPLDDAEAWAEELPAYSAYVEMVREFVEYCEKHGIPSLVPNLFEPASMFRRLSDAPEYDPSRPEMAEMYRRLIDLCIYQDKHLHAATTALQRRGGNEQAIGAIESAAAGRGVALPQLLARNPLQADTYAEALFLAGRYADVAAFCAAHADLATRPKLVECHLRSLITAGCDEEAAAFLDAHVGRLPTGVPDVRKAIGIACEQIGWSLYGAGEYSRAKAFIETHAAAEIQPQTGRENMKVLYRTICAAL